MAMALAELEDDSDSEYDPSKIPPAKYPYPPSKPIEYSPAPALPPPPPRAAQPPPTPPSQQQFPYPHYRQFNPRILVAPAYTHIEAMHEQIYEEAERDWHEIDRVFKAPMFASTEDLERAYQLLGKWGEQAEQKYAPEVITFIRMRGIAGPVVTERRKTELSRILGLRKQAQAMNAKPSPPLPPPQPPLSQHSETPVDFSTPAPSEENFSESVEHSSQQAANDRPTIRPPLYQAPDRPRSETRNRPSPRPPPPPPSRPSEPSPTIYAKSLRNGHASSATSHPPPHYPPVQHAPRAPSGPTSLPSYPESPIPSVYSPYRAFHCKHHHRDEPLSCIHSHRLIGRWLHIGLRQASIEELHFAQQRLEEWLYRGRPIEIEPELYERSLRDSRDGLMIEHNGWFADIRNELQRRQQQPAPSIISISPSIGTPVLRSPMVASYHASRSLSLPNGRDQRTSSVSTHSDRGPGPISQHSTPHLQHSSIPPDQRRPTGPELPERPTAPAAQNGRHPPRFEDPIAKYNLSSRDRETNYVRESRSSNDKRLLNSDGTRSRKHYQTEGERCNISASRIGSCSHEPEIEGMQTRSKSSGLAQPRVDHSGIEVRDPTHPDMSNGRQSSKRKRSFISEERRGKVAFRREDGHRDSEVILTTDEDADGIEQVEGQPSKIRSMTSSKSSEFLASLLEKSSKERLTKSVVKLCETNSLLLSWFKKDLQRPDISRDIAPLAEASMITPISPKRTRSGQGDSHANSEAPQRVTCIKCETKFDPAEARKHGECKFHEGDLIQKVNGSEQVTPIKDRKWCLDHEGSICIWTCCGGKGLETGCRSGKHTTSCNGEGSVTPEPQNATISELVNPLTSRPKHSSKQLDGEPSTFPGQDFLRQISEAEKELEKSEKLKEQQARSRSPPPSLRSGNSISQSSDTDFESIPDYCPPLDTLPEKDPKDIFDVGTIFNQAIDLSADPDRHLLHEAEIIAAQKLRLSCASYLTTKRRIFKALIETLQEGKDYKKSYAQNVCKVDARKTRALFTAYEAVGWFDPKNFTKYAPDAKLGTGEMSDSDLSSVDEQAIAGEPPELDPIENKSKPSNELAPSATKNIPPPDHRPSPDKNDSPKTLKPEGNTSNGTSEDNHTRPSSSSNPPKKREASPPYYTRAVSSFKPVNGPSSVALPPPSSLPTHPNDYHLRSSLTHSPRTRVPYLRRYPDAYRHYSSSSFENKPQAFATNGNNPSTPTSLSSGAPPYSYAYNLSTTDSPETYQWRKTESGVKQQVPICPYPRSWSEADSVDRELVRLKRHEGKQWDELFEWWRGRGRNSLKNASCLAVRYSILKKNFEEVWVAEGL